MIRQYKLLKIFFLPRKAKEANNPDIGDKFVLITYDQEVRKIYKNVFCYPQ
jgi:hypothetical protein